MRRSDRHICVFLLIAALSTTAFAQPPGPSAVPLAPVKGQWMVVYDFQDSNMERSLVGTFDIDGRFLRYRSVNTEITWDVDLADVDVILLEDTSGPAIVVSGILIDTVLNGERLRRRIAPVDENMVFITPVVLAGLLEQRLKAFRAAPVEPLAVPVRPQPPAPAKTQPAPPAKAQPGTPAKVQPAPPTKKGAEGAKPKPPPPPA